ncbi:CYFA0S13e01002g1_1 [Cyberlindnera fabianii]|uniref:triacylglycerol lipase n=1 Tax=Cyberlindnera fabianii TaxID=36022 RepID=A0A061BAN2_CYBFA|nr:CYFA0S13e01002g1_1 [Cyberlindnera fabianii]
MPSPLLSTISLLMSSTTLMLPTAASPTQTSLLVLLVQVIVNLAYCSFHPDIEIVKVIVPYMSKLEFSGTAFAAIDNTTDTVYVAFRGSSNAYDWINDLTVVQCPYAPYLSFYKLNSTTLAAVDQTKDTITQLIETLDDTDACGGTCLVHCGLHVSFLQFMDEIYDAVLPFLEHDYELIITGHSLGGGWAGLAGTDFKFKGYNPLVITYTALKQGNKQYNEFVDSMFGTSSKNLSIGRGRAFEEGDYVRVWSHYHIVPRLPPTDAYTNGGLQFELTVTEIPQDQSQVVYLGPSDNSVDSTRWWNIFDSQSYEIATNNKSYFIYLGTCDDN